MADERELLEAARAGDRAALDALLARHEGQIYRFGLSMCRDPEDAKEVLQETLLAMARNVGEFRGASSVSTWLYTIARSFCIKRRRRRKDAPAETRSLETDAAGEAARLADPARPPDEVLASRELADAMAHAIAALPADSREVLVLRDVEGLSAKEVSEVVGLSVEAVKSRLHRARIAVRDRMTAWLGEAEMVRGPRCPDVLDLFSRHLEDEISPEICAEMEQHLERCAHCRTACDSLRRTLSLCRTTRAEVPDDVQRAVRNEVRQLLGAGSA